MSDANPTDIEGPLERAQAASLVSALKDGVHTQVGDQGIRLSGGQRQRLALARALIKDPPILILDEATAMFDPEGESLLVADLKSVMAGRTLILITHRPASLVLADRILRLVDGQIRPA